jgi:hypothetical protein
MAIADLISQESDLVGLIVNAELSTTGLSVAVEFTDSKTGVARTPQSTTLDFVIDKDSSRWEQIHASSHSTASGVTTIVISATGRAIPKYGVGAGSGTGLRHPIGAQVGCVYTHNQVEQINKVLDGTNATGANTLRIGDETDSDISLIAQNADANKPYVRYDKTNNKWIYSNDGSSSGDVGGGTGTVTGGDGITMTAGDIDIDTTDTVIFKKTSAGAGDENKVPVLDASGQLAAGFMTTDVKTLVAGSTSVADALHTHNNFGTQSLTSGETINGGTNPVPVAIFGTGWRDQILVATNVNDRTASEVNMGDADATTRIGQGFVYTQTGTTSIVVNSIVLPLIKMGAPTDNFYIEIQTNNAGVPSGTVITNGTSDVIAGASIDATADCYAPYTFSFSTPPSITSATTYHIVFKRSGANDAGNYVKAEKQGANDYAGGTLARYQSSTATWTADAADDLNFKINLTLGGSGRVVTTASSSHFIGFQTNNTVAGGTSTVQVSGVVTGLSLGGAVAGDSIYLSGAGYTTAPTTSAIYIGKALSTSSLLLERGLKTVSGTTGTYSAYGAGAIVRTNDIFVKTGVKPQMIWLRSKGSHSSSTSTAGVLHTIGISGGAGVQLGALNASYQTVTAQSTVDFANAAFTSGVFTVTLQSIAENGFWLRYSQSNLSPLTWAAISWTVIGS